MVLINAINKISTSVLVTAFSFIILIIFCNQNILLSAKSVNTVEAYDGWGKYFFIQDDSKNNLDVPPSVLDSTNQSSSSAIDEGQTSENTTQGPSSSSTAIDEGQTNVNTSQNVETNQVQNNNQSQAQTNNQNVNINNQIQTQQKLESEIIEREG